MWIAGQLRQREEAQETAAAECGTVTLGGKRAGVLCRGEEREIPLALPAGFAWRPKGGERVVVVRGGTLGEERYLVGALCSEEVQGEIADGEICLHVGRARVYLRNNGNVEIEGNLLINGAAYVPPEG